MTLSADIFQTVVRPVSWALIHFLWQGSLVAIALALMLYLLRGHAAAVRYRWAVGALLMALVLPVWTTWHYLDSDRADRWFEATPPDTMPDSELTSAGSSAQASVVIEPTAPGTFSIFSLESTLPLVFSLWLGGVICLSLIHLDGWRRVRRLTRRRVRPVTRSWQQRVQELSRQLGIPRAVTMLESALVEVPAVVGWLRPVILMPAATLSGLPPALIESVIMHELAHVLRRDHLVNLLQVVAETLLFYHPAVWWISRQIRNERENCCDDIAVAACGDRVVYALALLSCEESREPVPSLALRASNGSLLRRVRRLIGGPSMNRHDLPGHHGPRLAVAALAVLFLAVGSILAFAAEWNFMDPVAGTARTQPSGQVAQATGEETERDSRESENREDETRRADEAEATIAGKWEAELKDGEIKLKLHTRGEWESHFTVRTETSNFTGLTFSDEVSFLLSREAGEFRFEGDLGGSPRSGSGEGRFTFTVDRRFPRRMERLGVTDLDDQMIFVLAATDVGSAYVEGLQERGYDKVSGEELIALAIHRVDLEYIDTMAELGFGDEDLEKLLAMRIHGVNAEFIDELAKLGFTNLDTDELMAWRIHGLDAEFIDEMKDIGFTDLDAEELVAMRIHGVTPAFVKKMRGLGFERLDAEEAVAFRIHGVSPEFIAEMRELGYEDLTEDDLLAMRIHHITPDFIEELAELGYTNVPAEDLVAMRIHGITIRHIKKLHEQGYTDLDIDDMVHMRVHGEEI